MAVNLEAVLGMRNLVGLIQSVVSRVPEDLLPEAMYKATRSIEGNRGTYFKVRGSTTARIVQYGGPSRARELPGVSEEPLTLLHAFEHCIHNAALLQNLAAETQNDSNSEIKQRLGFGNDHAADRGLWRPLPQPASFRNLLGLGNGLHLLRQPGELAADEHRLGLFRELRHSGKHGHHAGNAIRQHRIVEHCAWHGHPEHGMEFAQRNYRTRHGRHPGTDYSVEESRWAADGV